MKNVVGKEVVMATIHDVALKAGVSVTTVRVY